MKKNKEDKKSPQTKQIRIGFRTIKVAGAIQVRHCRWQIKQA